MNKLIIVFVSLFALVSCDNRDVFIKQLNLPPDFQLTNLDGKNIGLDSIKLSLKSTNLVSRYKLVVNGNNLEKSVFVKTVNGSGTVLFNGQSGDGERKVTNGTYTLTFTPSASGTTLINLELEDSYKNKKELSTSVVAFSNLPPVAAVALNNISVNDPREYLIDASSSFDRDASFGGFISSYTFKIANKSFTTDKSSIKWIFGDKGNYEIGVTVTDSDGAASTFTKIFSIQ